jgi:hypothetical protein
LDLGRRLRSKGCGSMQAKRVAAALDYGGGAAVRRRRLAGHLAGDAKKTLLCTKQQRKGTKIKRRGRGFHRATRRGRRGAGGVDRRRGAAGGLLLRRGSGSARVLAGEVVRRDWGGDRPFIRGGGQARRRRGGGRRSYRRPPLPLGGGLGGCPFPGEEEAGAVWGGTVECSAHWREGEAARGGGSTPARAARAAMGEKGIGWGLKTALTGGLHLSAARESERGLAGWLALGGPAAVFVPHGEKTCWARWAGWREWVRDCFGLFFYFLFKF